MVDFKKLHDDWYAGLDPEARARVDARAAEEARWEATAADIAAVFEQIEWKKPPTPAPAGLRRPGAMFRPVPAAPARRPNEPLRETEVVKTWEQAIRVRIEDRQGRDGGAYEVVKFIGDPTGHASFRLDEEFCAMLVDPEENRLRPRFYLCAGTPGSWYGCSVSPADLEAFLRAARPGLFPAAAPTRAP